VEVPLLQHWSRWSKIFIDLEVGYIIFIINACAGA
jgi:hypothetical protein